MKDNMSALAVKVGELQARILRLDAFGQRLAKAAGIKADEFRFDEKPGQGGPPCRRAATSRSTNSRRCSPSSRRARRSQRQARRARLLPDGRPPARKTIPTTMPVPMGYYSSNYGYRIDPINGSHTFHTGVDLIAPPGTPVVAAAGGVVSTVAYVAEYGNMVEVDHDNGLTSRYATSRRAW
jgi:murein DD-endopeptidase MepM/ murein hydrolase activator NlpD